MYQIYGRSDDLVYVDYNHGEKVEEIGCYNSDVILTIGNPEEVNEYFYVKMSYGPSWNEAACWSAEILQSAEDSSIPWSVTIRTAENKYSVLVIVDCPRVIPFQYKVIGKK